MSESMSQTLGSVISIAKGKKHEITDLPSGQAKRLIGIDDLRNDDFIRYTNDARGTEAIPDDVLIAWDGANAGTIGFGKSGYIGSTIARLRVRADMPLFTPFLGAYLKSKFDYLRQTATGATIPHINRSALESIPLPAIKYDDQIRIAHLLGKVEGLIDHRKQHLQQLGDLLKSVFQEMFGFLDGTYVRWRVERLSSSCEVVSGVAKGKKYATEQLVEVPYMRVANVQDGHFVLDEIKTIAVTPKEIDQYQLQRGDLLLTEGGDPDKLGRGSVWEGQVPNCIHQNHIFRVRINQYEQLNPYYLSALFGSRYGKSYFLKSAKQTTGIASINSTQLKTFPTVIPPIDLQNQFAVIVGKIEGIKSNYQQSLTDLETLYGSLRQKAFKGELDLSRVPLPSQVDEVPDLTKQANIEPKTPASFQLPESENPDWLAVENRPMLIEFWLIAWFEQYADEPFTASRFMDAAYQRLAELSEQHTFQFDKPDKGFDEAKCYEEPEPFGTNEYEQIKKWVFEALASGKLTQGFDDAVNRIQLKATQA